MDSYPFLSSKDNGSPHSKGFIVGVGSKHKVRSLWKFCGTIGNKLIFFNHFVLQSIRFFAGFQEALLRSISFCQFKPALCLNHLAFWKLRYIQQIIMCIQNCGIGILIP